MGRTNSTYRNHLDEFMQSFQPFRKALRKDRKNFFDMLWEKAHSHAQAGSYMNSFRPEIPALVSMMLGLQAETSQNQESIEEMRCEITRLEERLGDMEEKITELESEPDELK